MSGAEGGDLVLHIGAAVRSPPERGDVVRSIALGGYIVSEHESGAITVTEGGVDVTPVKPVLRKLAQQLSVSLDNARGNPFNTQQLGTNVINAALVAKKALKLSTCRVGAIALFPACYSPPPFALVFRLPAVCRPQSSS